MPTACTALEACAARAKLEPGQPVFRPIDQRQIIGAARLTDRGAHPQVARACLLILRGKTNVEADELFERFSGHSMRAGYVDVG